MPATERRPPPIGGRFMTTKPEPLRWRRFTPTAPLRVARSQVWQRDCRLSIGGSSALQRDSEKQIGNQKIGMQDRRIAV
jgi:hypothetical protein